jgi:tetratricopeptide (TPR) repeat protein
MAHRLAGRARAAVLVLTCTLACDSRARSTRNVAQDTATARTADLLAEADAIYFESNDSAASLWQAARRLAASTNDSASMARALTGLALVARHRLDLGQARALGEQALAIKLRFGMRDQLFRSYNALGLVAWDDGRLRDAVDLFRQARQAAAAVGDSAGIGKAAINAGLVQIDLGDLASARASLLSGKRLVEATRDSVNIGRALLNLAALDNDIGDPLSALATIESARTVFRVTGDTLSDVNALGQMALAYDALGEPQRAFIALDSALVRARRLGLRKEEAEDLKIQGDFFASAGDHRRALGYYARAAAAIDSVAMPDERANLVRNEARSQVALGRRDLAVKFADQALRLHESGGFLLGQVTDLLFLAQLASEDGRVSDAERALASARRAASTVGGEHLRTQVVLADARLADRTGDAVRALRTLSTLRTDLIAVGA